jgi:uncharacterized protein YdhG (YjbR/CyaY superfamily)
VATGDIDSDLAGMTSRSAEPLEQLRRSIRAALPDAEESMSYGLPAFKIQVKIIAGFAAFNNRLSYLPHSGSALPNLASDLAGYESTKGSLHFPIDQPLPQASVHSPVKARLRELGLYTVSSPGPIASLRV